MTKAKSKSVIVLMPFAPTFDSLFDSITNAVNDIGVRCERVDTQIFTEQIMQHVYEQIARADIVVAVVSEPNVNVYYEVGYAHALNKATVLLTRDTAGIPFDLKGYPHVALTDDITELTKQLQTRVKELIRAPRQPFSSAYFDRFFQERLTDISPPNLLLLAVADGLNFPSAHGSKIASTKPEWAHESADWDERSKDMEALGLLHRNTVNEVERTQLGTAVVYLALRVSGFAEVAAAIKTDRTTARKWGVVGASDAS